MQGMSMQKIYNKFRAEGARKFLGLFFLDFENPQILQKNPPLCFGGLGKQGGFSAGSQNRQMGDPTDWARQAEKNEGK